MIPILAFKVQKFLLNKIFSEIFISALLVWWVVFKKKNIFSKMFRLVDNGIYLENLGIGKNDNILWNKNKNKKIEICGKIV